MACTLLSYTKRLQPKVQPLCSLGCVQTDATTLLRQQCWELLLGACWQWSANECNTSQQCWDLQYIVGTIQLISLCKPCVMSLRGPNIVGRAVQRIQHCCATLRRSGNKRNVGSCWLKSLTGFKICATTRNNIQQNTITYANGRNM